MKTEKAFNHKLKRCLRCARKKQMPHKVASQMGLNAGIYFGLEQGMFPMSVYNLYAFMHATGQDAEFVKQIFDDNWNPPSMGKNNK